MKTTKKEQHPWKYGIKTLTYSTPWLTGRLNSNLKHLVEKISVVTSSLIFQITIFSEKNKY